ncbi:hypothetical protein ACFFHM_00495 [Halalkalibacter kiskunsagensis]|uniref:Uncharacterized protein n=1 Tax=Halalkalibacter kiskunsagensis TaxID=1548599 RepID=A0ABV6K834_9BACI
MDSVKEVEVLTRQYLVKILKDTYKKGTENPDLSSKQVVEEIAQFLKPFVKS